jgi:nucleotide-binding universal stress UspA family protein
MYTRLLIHLDGSQPVEQVLPYARFFARALEIPVELLEVIGPDIATLPDCKWERSVEVFLAEKERTNTDYLGMIARSLDPAAVEWIVESGKPEEVVLNRAATYNSTLIAMSTHDRSRIQRWLFGSVWKNVLRSTTNHLLLVRASKQDGTLRDTSPKRVVAPLDGSGLAEKVLPYVVDLAKKMKLEVVLMRVFAPTVSITALGYWPDLGAFMSLLEPEGDYLAKKVKELKEKGLENVSSIVRCGYIAGEIIRVAQTNPDSFVAMCTRDRSGIKGSVLGSVTERVAHLSKVPVLIIPAS